LSCSAAGQDCGLLMRKVKWNSQRQRQSKSNRKCAPLPLIASATHNPLKSVFLFVHFLNLYIRGEIAQKKTRGFVVYYNRFSDFGFIFLFRFCLLRSSFIIIIRQGRRVRRQWRRSFCRAMGGPSARIVAAAPPGSALGRRPTARRGARTRSWWTAFCRREVRTGCWAQLRAVLGEEVRRRWTGGWGNGMY
jgi:hypothetical protein